MCHCSVTHRLLHSFPTRRSSDLAHPDHVREMAVRVDQPGDERASGEVDPRSVGGYGDTRCGSDLHDFAITHDHRATIDQDRKSTRLNSSHGYISYAVFCLKKKNT